MLHLSGARLHIGRPLLLYVGWRRSPRRRRSAHLIDRGPWLMHLRGTRLLLISGARLLHIGGPLLLHVGRRRIPWRRGSAQPLLAIIY